MRQSPGATGLPPVSGFTSVLANICPRRDCYVISSKAALLCERHPELCVISEFPPKPVPIPECGPVSCPEPWFDIRNPAMFVAGADGAKVARAKGASVRSIGDKDFRTLDEGVTLRAGDVLRLPPGAVFEARSAQGSFATPVDG